VRLTVPSFDSLTAPPWSTTVVKGGGKKNVAARRPTAVRILLGEVHARIVVTFVLHGRW
jgi:hypothetical protein